MFEIRFSRNVVPLCAECGGHMKYTQEDDDPYSAESNLLLHVHSCQRCEEDRDLEEVAADAKGGAMMTDFEKRLDELEIVIRKGSAVATIRDALAAISIARALLKENEAMKDSMRSIQATIPSSRRWTHNELAHWVGKVEE